MTFNFMELNRFAKGMNRSTELYMQWSNTGSMEVRNILVSLYETYTELDSQEHLTYRSLAGFGFALDALMKQQGMKPSLDSLKTLLGSMWISNDERYKNG